MPSDKDILKFNRERREENKRTEEQSRTQELAPLICLGAHENMTPKEALTLSIRDDLKEVIVIGYDQDDILTIRSSKMRVKDSLWLLEMAKKHTLEVPYTSEDDDYE